MQKITNFIVRYKILHILFWGYAFISDWHFMQYLRPDDEHALLNIVDSIVALCFDILCVYTCIWYLFPLYFVTKRYLIFAVSTFGITVLCSTLGVITQVTYVPLVLQDQIDPTPLELIVTFTARFVDMATATLVLLGVHLTYYFYHKEKTTQEKEKRRLEAELVHLKSQLSLDFILKALNGIDLELKVDQEHASELLNRFAALMKYSLQTSTLDAISLEEEIAFVEHYIEIQKLIRQHTLSITYVIENQTPNKEIPRHLLLPLIDHAFKWSSTGDDQENQITIALTSHALGFTLDVTNTVNKDMHLLLPRQHDALEQIKKRLALHFPQRHTFELHSTTLLHAVKLTWKWS